jgi:hypothetical protein
LVLVHKLVDEYAVMKWDVKINVSFLI